MADKEVNVKLNIEPRVNPGARMGADALSKMKDKVGASPEQLAELRNMALKHASSGGALSELLPEAKVAGGNWFQKMVGKFVGAGGLGKMGSGLNLLSSVAGGNLGGMAGSIGGLVGGPVGMAVGAASSQVLGFLQELPSRVMALVHSLDSWVKIASPGTSERFSRTMMDMYGVVGQMLTPALEIANKTFRAIADSIANSGLKREFAETWKQFDKGFADLKPAIMGTVQYLAALTTGLLKFGNTILKVREGFSKSPLGRAVVWARGKVVGEGIDGASAGAAAHSPSYSGFFEYGRQARLQAYGSVGVSPAERTAKAGEESRNFLEQIRDAIAKDKDREWRRRVERIASHGA